ncbi:MAG TPA: aspartate aminotransferase family protein [Stellaceae bacterium]|nr:aspartate aminotransferase family protein [Stellaceae bacterium]
MQRGNSAASRDIANHLHPYTHLKKHESEGPLVITEGKGIHVYDENGKEYIEGLAGLWCTALGFGEERLVDAATRQLKRLPYYHIFNHKSHDIAAELAERLIALMPVKMSKVFFNNSGSEANDTAVKMVWYYNNARGRHRKKKIIARVKGYHGVTVAAASLTGLPNNHRDFDLPIDNIRHADCPHHYRFAKPGESEEAFATRLADSLEAQILREDPETVAAFIAEPVMGAGGVIVPPKTYFEKIQAVLKKYDVLLIADEVICGFGRTGNMWGSDTFGLKPDILTMAKALSSAYLPISATVISEELYQAFIAQSEKLGQFAHGFTYSGHPVCCAVAVETLKIYEERDIVAQVRKVAPRLQNGMRRFADHPLVGEVRGVGLITAAELVRDKASKAPFDPKQAVGPLFAARAQEHGLIVRAMGDSIALCPPLIITGDQIDEMLRRFGQALDDTAAAVSRPGLAPVA